MIKRILNYFFGKKETNETQVNSIHDEINETLKKRQEILDSLEQDKVILSETVSTEKPKKTKAPRKPKSEFPIESDKVTKAKPVRKAKAPAASTEEKPKRTRKPKTDK
jgi:type II secretory pathway component PulC